MSSNTFLDGFMSNGLAVFSDSRERTYVACGIQVEALLLENASLGFLNQCEAEIRGLLRTLRRGLRLQLSWRLESDFSECLLSYYECTTSAILNAFASRERHERAARYLKATKSGELRSQRVSVYISSLLASTRGDMGHILEAEAKGFDVLENEIRGAFERLGGRVKREGVSFFV